LFTQIILLSFCGGLLCLDRIFIQAMISRPIIIAPIIGLILNNPYAGLIIGAMIEMFWIDRVPIGIYIPPNDSLVAVLATSVAILAGGKLGSVSPELIAFSILLFIPFGILAKQIDILIIKSNDVLSDQALEDGVRSDIRAIEQKTYLGLLKVLSFYIIYLLVLQAIFIPAVIWIYPQLTSAIIKMLAMIYYFLPLLGIAVALNTIKLRGAIPVFCAIFLIIAVSLEFFHVI
jgi:PTS system mannose-specific IIC component